MNYKEGVSVRGVFFIRIKAVALALDLCLQNAAIGYHC